MFDLTEAARKAICKEAAKCKLFPRALRVGLRAGGCNGFSYVFEWAHEVDGVVAHQLSYASNNGFVSPLFVITDQKSMTLLEGATLDYESTLMQSGFKWINPNQKNVCGCGKSVTF